VQGYRTSARIPQRHLCQTPQLSDFAICLHRTGHLPDDRLDNRKKILYIAQEGRDIIVHNLDAFDKMNVLTALFAALTRVRIAGVDPTVFIFAAFARCQLPSW
jgi:hypothetical protein